MFLENNMTLKEIEQKKEYLNSLNPFTEYELDCITI